MKKRNWMLAALALGLVSGAAQAQMGYMAGTWGTSPMEFPAGNLGATAMTLREIVHTSIAGNQFTAVVLSNEFGRQPLTISAVTVAHRMSGSTTDTPVAVTFGGQPGVTIPPGKRVVSDEAHFKFPAQSDVAVSLYVPGQTMTATTGHGFADTTNYSAEGDQTAATDLTDAKEMAAWRYVVELEVGTATQGSIICLGDSITDGAHSTRDANHRWPDVLAARLLADPAIGERLGVLNEGIGGNRILRDGTGPALLARLDRDVFNTGGYYATGRRYVILLEGINDIGHAYDPNGKRNSANQTDAPVTAAELIAADHLVIVRAHAWGLKIFGATLTPYVGAKYSSPEGEKVRAALNDWIRNGGEFDGVVDFDKATRDPANPTQFLPAYDSGDHLHPSDAGYKAMGEAIDLKLFQK